MPDRAAHRSDALPALAVIDAIPLAAVAFMLSGSIIGGQAFGFSYAGGPINTVFLSAAGLWLLGRIARTISPATARVARTAECMGLLLLLSLLASIASAVLAASGAALIDPSLAAADRIVFPWLLWPDMIAMLKDHPTTLRALSYIYVSLNWQPVLLVASVLISKRDDVLRKFLATWAICLLTCIVSFYWWPAAGPYPYYHIGNGPEYGHLVSLPFETPAILNTLRGDGPLIVSKETITGLITMPSFHACSAVILGWAFCAWPSLRWPMVMLNGAMIVSAIPAGGHYYVDVIAGCAVAVAAIAVVELLARMRVANGTAARILPTPAIA